MFEWLSILKRVEFILGVREKGIPKDSRVPYLDPTQVLWLRRLRRFGKKQVKEFGKLESWLWSMAWVKLWT